MNKLIKELPAPYSEKEWDDTMKALSKQSLKSLKKEVDKVIGEVLSTNQAAEKLGVSERTIRNMIERGSIHAYKTDPTSKSMYKIPADEIEKILKERAKTQGARSRV